MWWLVALFLLLPAGCGIKGCACQETSTITRSSADGTTTTAITVPNQVGEPTTLHLVVPPKTDVSLCVC